MIRILLTSGKKAYGFDVTNWENKPSNWYDNLLTEEASLLIYNNLFPNILN